MATIYPKLRKPFFDMALPEGLSDILPLSPAQTGMLFHILESETARSRYVAVVSQVLIGPLDAARLQRAFNATTNAHDAFRASFLWQKIKKPVQAIRTEVDVPWTNLDWSSIPKSVQDEKLAELTQAEQSRRFDLSKAPLMYVHLVKLADDKHQLVWTIQHLISDGWSTANAMDEVFKRYDGAETGGPSASFRDYLTWLKRNEKPESEVFWREHLKGLSRPTLVDLAKPTDNRVGEAQIRRMLSKSTSSKVSIFAKELEITEATLLSSIWALVLRQITRSDDVIFGLTSAGRPVDMPGIATAIGAFVNTLPLRMQIDRHQTLKSLLKDAARHHHTRKDHELTPLGKVQAQSECPADTPLFDTLFVHQGVPEAQKTYGTITLGDLDIVQTSNYALALLARPGAGLQLELCYDTAKIADHAAEGVLAAFVATLERSIQNPDVKIADLNQSPPALAATAYEDVVERFLHHAKTTPDAPAITDETGTFSYAELMAKAVGIASQLRIASDTIVPVALPRGAESIAAFLGIQMAGGAYVPLDLSYPESRTAQILKAIDPTVIVSTPQIFDTLPSTGSQLISPATSHASYAPIQGELSYVIFTSGSQGVPKGVEITRAGLAFSTGVREKVFQSPPKAFLLLSSLAFDSSVVGIYWTLAEGGHLVIAPERAEQDADGIGRRIKDYVVTHTLCLPGLYQALLHNVTPNDLSTLQTVLVAGEAMPHGLATLHRETVPNARLFNEYGPTEGTVWCSAQDVTQHDTSAPAPIGTPPTGLSLRLIDTDGAPVGAGMIGELQISGPTIARGYLNDPIQTKERFGTHNGTKVRYFNTGDLALKDHNGAFIFLGRDDDQVKIRGHRVELGDVLAAAQTAAPGKRMSVVAPHIGATRRLVLAIEGPVYGPGGTNLMTQLNRLLPSHLVPTDVRFLDQLPRLPNGKTDTSKLEEMVAVSPVLSKTDPELTTDLASQLKDIWISVLGRDDIGANDNFFDIGGDSLSSITVFARAQELGLKISPTDLFDHPTLAELEAHLTRTMTEDIDHQGAAEFRTANTSGTQPALLLLHANMGVFRNVVNGLGDDYPTALLFSHHFMGLEPPTDTTVEALAADAITKLRGLRQEGPYMICGYSAGACIAQEVALQLQSTGDEVKILTLIDPPYGLKPHDKDSGFGERLRQQAKAAYQSIAPILTKDKDAARRTKVDKSYSAALSDYRIRPYGGATQVILTPDNPAMESGAPLAQSLQDPQIDRIETDHEALLSDPANALAVATRIIARIKSIT